MSGAREVLKKTAGIELLEIKVADKTRKLGFARFRGRIDRREFVEYMQRKYIHVYSLERTDRPLVQNLRELITRAEAAGDVTIDTGHAALAPALAALGILRAWRCQVRAANSQFAVIPRIERLFVVLDSHLALLAARGIPVPTPKPGDEAGRIPRSGRKLFRRWGYKGSELTATTRAIELPVFDHFVRELRKIEKEAAAVAQRVASKNERAARQHRKSSERARQLATLLRRGTAAMRFVD